MLAQDRMIAFETHNFLLEQEVKGLEMDLEVYEELIAENDEHRELWEKEFERWQNRIYYYSKEKRHSI